jgi:hypothetical protein
MIWLSGSFVSCSEAASAFGGGIPPATGAGVASQRHWAEDFTMAEINKLSVGQAIDKIRGKDAPKSKMDQLDQKIDKLEAFKIGTSSY